MKFNCAHCGLYAKQGLKCYLRFSKSPKVKYVFIKQKTPEGGAQDRCISMTPAPRIQDPDGTCEAWQSPAGQSREQVIAAAKR